MSTLSVDTSSSGSSTATSSPSCFSQRVMVPSVTDSPSAGICTRSPSPEPPPEDAASSPDVPDCSCPPSPRSPSPWGSAGSWPPSSPASATASPVGGVLHLVGRAVAGVLGLLLARRVVGGAATVGRRAVADDREVGADGDGVVLLDEDLLQGAGDRGGDLGVDLVGGDLEERLVDLHRVADALEPPRDRPLGDGLAERGHLYAF